MRQRIWWVVLAATACCPAMPSAAPLGSGPRAEAEPDESETEGRRPKTARAEKRDSEATDQEGKAKPRAAATGKAPKPTAAKAPAKPTAAEENPVFVGEYGGRHEATVRLEGVPQRKQVDPKARVNVERNSETEVTITLLSPATGNPYCTLTGTVKGNVATLTAGQSCSAPDAVGTFSGSVTQGTANVVARCLQINLELDIEGEHGGQPVSGTLKYYFIGWRPQE